MTGYESLTKFLRVTRALLVHWMGSAAEKYCDISVAQEMTAVCDNDVVLGKSGTLSITFTTSLLWYLQADFISIKRVKTHPVETSMEKQGLCVIHRMLNSFSFDVLSVSSPSTLIQTSPVLKHWKVQPLKCP